MNTCATLHAQADFVPKSNFEEWLKHLRSEFPAIAFKATAEGEPIVSSQTGLTLTVCGGHQMVFKALTWAHSNMIHTTGRSYMRRWHGDGLELGNGVTSFFVCIHF